MAFAGQKQTGFRELFDLLKARGMETRPPSAWKVSKEELAGIFGVPRRSPSKYCRDLAVKARERVRR